jgi:hypothetical protein
MITRIIASMTTVPMAVDQRKSASGCVVVVVPSRAL